MKVLSISLLLLLLVLAGCSGVDDQPLAPGPDAGLKAYGPSGCSGVRVVPPMAMPGGKSYAEWSALWWRWLWSAPVDHNPGLDETGAFVDWNQDGNVWFLAPAYYGVWERTAEIPVGKMLFIDLAANFMAINTGDGANEQELREAAAWATDNISDIVLRIDGWELDNVGDYRVTSPDGLFSYTLPENNMFQFFGLPVEAGTYDDAVADGYYAMVRPLPRGEHTIFMSAHFGEPFNDTIQVTYHLRVVGRGDYHHVDHDHGHGRHH